VGGEAVKRPQLHRIAAEYAVLLDLAPDMETIGAILEDVVGNPCVTEVEALMLDSVADRRERLLRADLDN